MSTRLTRKEMQERTRRRLVEVAARHFRRDGFHQASGEAIAAEAGFTRGAVYANFDGKAGLFLAVLDEEVGARAALLGRPEGPDELAARYEALLDADRGWSLALLEFTIHAARRPELAAELRERNLRVREAVARVIHAVQPGTTAGDAEAGARFVLALNSGVSIERALDPEAAGAAELARGYRASLVPRDG